MVAANPATLEDRLHDIFRQALRKVGGDRNAERGLALGQGGEDAFGQMRGAFRDPARSRADRWLGTITNDHVSIFVVLRASERGLEPRVCIRDG